MFVVILSKGFIGDPMILVGNCLNSKAESEGGPEKQPGVCPWFQV